MNKNVALFLGILLLIGEYVAIGSHELCSACVFAICAAICLYAIDPVHDDEEEDDDE